MKIRFSPVYKRIQSGNRLNM
eukprot:COSAG01_NODE_11445_length_1931_cov_1.588428_1_plen_20_part_10